MTDYSREVSTARTRSRSACYKEAGGQIIGDRGKQVYGSRVGS